MNTITPPLWDSQYNRDKAGPSWDNQVIQGGVKKDESVTPRLGKNTSGCGGRDQEIWRGGLHTWKHSINTSEHNYLDFHSKAELDLVFFHVSYVKSELHREKCPLLHN